MTGLKYSSYKVTKCNFERVKFPSRSVFNRKARISVAVNRICEYQNRKHEYIIDTVWNLRLDIGARYSFTITEILVWDCDLQLTFRYSYSKVLISKRKIIKILWRSNQFCMKNAWVLSYQLSAQRRLRSDWADVQADLSLRWAHSHFVCFVTRRLISSVCWWCYILYLLVWCFLDHVSRLN